MVDQVVPRDAPGEADLTPPADRRRRRLITAAAAAVATAALPLAARAQALARVKERGRLSVAVYHDMPPFHVGGEGIDVLLARALAQHLGVTLSLLPFHAGESMGDDLRNMVWRGHYLGFGPADVMLHVPVDPPLMRATPQVEIFAPYYRERVMIARRLDAVPRMDGLADFGTQRIAVAGQSLAGWLLIGAEGGRYRDQLDTKIADGTEAAHRLRRGEVAGAAGLASELESVLGGASGVAIEPLPLPQMRNGWAVGMAVKRDARDLAQALQAAVEALAASGELAAMFASRNVSWRRP